MKKAELERLGAKFKATRDLNEAEFDSLVAAVKCEDDPVTGSYLYQSLNATQESLLKQYHPRSQLAADGFYYDPMSGHYLVKK